VRARFANRRVCDRLLGLGYDIAEKMGLLCDTARLGYHTQELRIVDDHRPRLSGFGGRVFRGLTGGRYITLVRNDLSKLIDDRISRSCEIIFGDSITILRKAHGEVHVEFEHSGERHFDLVIGADGFIPAYGNSSLARKTDTRRI
jgi:2-polyprenyl-6-methoxyphenol hydroxylase-like FAD-dependent oxidoreductase